MVDDILRAAGIKYKEVRFLTPPIGTYAVWFDSYDVRGSDDVLCIMEHTYTIELYSNEIDRESEQKIEQQLHERGLRYTKQERQWIASEQLYQVVFSFDFIEKGVYNNG